MLVIATSPSSSSKVPIGKSMRSFIHSGMLPEPSSKVIIFFCFFDGGFASSSSSLLAFASCASAASPSASFSCSSCKRLFNSFSSTAFIPPSTDSGSLSVIAPEPSRVSASDECASEDDDSPYSLPSVSVFILFDFDFVNLDIISSISCFALMYCDCDLYESTPSRISWRCCRIASLRFLKLALRAFLISRKDLPTLVDSLPCAEFMLSSSSYRCDMDRLNAFRLCFVLMVGFVRFVPPYPLSMSKCCLADAAGGSAAPPTLPKSLEMTDFPGELLASSMCLKRSCKTSSLTVAM